jgi:hypothetical protein
MYRRIVTAIAVLLLLLPIACSDDSTSPPVNNDPPVGGVDISYQPETPQAASATVTAAAGGQVAATGTAGVELALTIPGGALAADATITITPLLDLSFDPLNKDKEGVADCVQGGLFEPEGLTFAEPVILTITYPETGLDCLPGATHRIVAFSDTSTFYEILPTVWDETARALSCTLQHFSGYGVDDMNDHDFLEYMITETIRHAPGFPGEDDLNKLLSYAQEAALQDWDDLVQLALAGAEPVLDALVTPAIAAAVADPSVSAMNLLAHYREIAQRWDFQAVENRIIVAQDQLVRAYAARGRSSCENDQQQAGRAMLQQALDWAMMGHVTGDDEAFITQVQEWLDDCGAINVTLVSDKGLAYQMVLDHDDRDMAQVTFTVAISGVSGDALEGKEVQIYWDKYGDVRPYPAGSGITDENGEFQVIQGATTVLPTGGCLPSKTVQYYAEVFHNGEWQRSGTIAVTYKALMIFNSISYVYSYDASDEIWTRAANASLLGSGTSPNGCSGVENCDALMTRSYDQFSNSGSITTMVEESQISACRASLVYGVEIDDVTGETYLVIAGITVRDLDEIMHGLTAESCPVDDGCRTISFDAGLCDPEAAGAHCGMSSMYWPSDANGDLTFTHMGDGNFDPFNWGYGDQYGSASLAITVGCGYE